MPNAVDNQGLYDLDDPLLVTAVQLSFILGIHYLWRTIFHAVSERRIRRLIRGECISKFFNGYKHRTAIRSPGKQNSSADSHAGQRISAREAWQAPARMFRCRSEPYKSMAKHFQFCQFELRRSDVPVCPVLVL